MNGTELILLGGQFGNKIAVRNKVVQFALTWGHLGEENELQYINQCPHADAGQLAAIMYIKGEFWKELKN